MSVKLWESEMLTLAEYLKAPCASLSIPYWKAVRTAIPENMEIIHDRDFTRSAWSGYADTPYFRLYHDLRKIEQMIPEGIVFATAQPEDLEIICSVINRAYTDLQVTLAQLKGYTQLPVYNEQLWVLAREKVSNVCVGCGIADLDREAGELILEWIQVLPEYRQRGIGRAIVSELLCRGRGSADFATVSGKCSPAAPECLYRSCGFVGNDIWHILRKL